MRGLIVASLIAVAGVTPATAAVPTTAFGAVRSGYASVNGLQMYYEVHGTNTSTTPLILLHGDLGSIEMYAALLPSLAADRQVIAADLQGHGRTADVDRPLSYEAMADDVAALIAYLGFNPSPRGGAQARAGFHGLPAGWVVPRSPGRRGADGSRGSRADEADPDAPALRGHRSAAAGLACARDEDGRPAAGELRLDRGSRGAEDAFPDRGADADAVRTAHMLELFCMFGRGTRDAGWDGSGRPRAELAILPATSHCTIFMSPALPAAVTPFLDAPMPQNK